MPANKLNEIIDAVYGELGQKLAISTVNLMSYSNRRNEIEESKKDLDLRIRKVISLCPVHLQDSISIKRRSERITPEKRRIAEYT